MTTPMKATHRLVTNDGSEFYVGIDPDGIYQTFYGHCFQQNQIHSLNPLPTLSDPENFDWLAAMRLLSYKIPIQYQSRDGTWIDLCGTSPRFCKESVYRRKPIATPEPKVTEYWVNYYPVTGISSPLGDTYLSKKECEEEAQIDATARLKITVTEGELPKVEVIPV